jgi:hypothetical protein
METIFNLIILVSLFLLSGGLFLLAYSSYLDSKNKNKR